MTTIAINLGTKPWQNSQGTQSRVLHYINTLETVLWNQKMNNQVQTTCEMLGQCCHPLSVQSTKMMNCLITYFATWKKLDLTLECTRYSKVDKLGKAEKKGQIALCWDASETIESVQIQSTKLFHQWQKSPGCCHGCHCLQQQNPPAWPFI